MAKSRKPSRSSDGIKTHPRKMMPMEQFEARRDIFEQLALEANYIGVWYHKRKPEKFGLKREGNNRKSKSLCDEWGPPVLLSQGEAKNLLSQGIKYGLISAEPHCEDAYKRKWPRNVWALTESGVPLEAKYDGSSDGTGYHGYPLDKTAPLYDEIVKRWPK